MAQLSALPAAKSAIYARMLDVEPAYLQAGQRAGRIPADIEPREAAALVIAASDGLQIQWLLDPEAVDVGRSLALLERLLPAAPGE